ncbi:hypothetical protein A9995_15045 [Erythrobacter sp. QSSC1-22B]|uniref:2-hydroxychromene-2-carboxylate isomerase n=1 Tax=Erythrobacter sp. QSSC1-22B TaxID=1860125 RepID=UPI000805E0DB|nr:DsbA family protein [Erythrobacter sp. QSSC1-22B]OBX17701.1 hypothetical protein A9995_15045 [Erythrobacter sp. QSSC1-22B]
MSEPIKLYYDFVSPYSYFAFGQRADIEQRTGRRVELLPVAVGMVMEKVGNVPTSLTCKAKRTYSGQDVARWVARLGVPFAVHPAFGTFSTAPLLQAALVAGDDVEAFSKAAFAAVWAEQAPIGDDEKMRDFFAAKNERFVRYWTTRDDAKNALDKRVDKAVSDGVFGVPFFHTDNGNFFGNDRLDFLVEAMTA